MYQDKKVVFLFSGLGSQHINMGAQFYKEISQFRYHMDQLDEELYIATGISVTKELYQNRNSKLLEHDAAFACVALFEVQYALAMTLKEKGLYPDLLIGTSLGEYVAYAVSGAIVPSFIIKSLYETVDHIQKTIVESDMLTVVSDVNRDYYSDHRINSIGEVGAINTDNHFMISGTLDEINTLKKYYAEKHIFTYQIGAKVGFHSPKLIKAFANIGAYYMSQVPIMKPSIPILSCTTGNEVSEISYNTLFDILQEPILFQKAVQKIDSSKEVICYDLGPMGTLSNFARHNIKKDNVAIEAFSTMSGDNLTNYHRI